MNGRELLRRRLRAQRLAGNPLPSPVDALRWLGAAQAQELAYARDSLATRAAAAGDGAPHDAAAIDRLLAEGAILRTHLLRPTWHFVLPEDLRWMTARTAPRVRAAMAAADRELELDDRLRTIAYRLFERALAGGRHRTRTGLAEILAAGGIEARGRRLAHLVMRAELDLVLCSGAPHGRQQTYALVDERVPASPALAADEALAELARRYFRSRGPATARDFAWWATLPLGEARRAIAMLGDELATFDDGDRTYVGFAEPPPAGRSAPRVHLLQGFDEYLVAYTESRDLAAPRTASAAGARRGPRDSVLFAHPVLVDGVVAGRWKRVIGPRSAAIALDLDLEPPLPRAVERDLAAAVERQLLHLGVPAHAAIAVDGAPAKRR